jgi:hypothetical protein
MLSTKPRKNRCANKPSWVVTVAVNIQISDQRSTTAPKIRPSAGGQRLEDIGLLAFRSKRGMLPRTDGW